MVLQNIDDSSAYKLTSNSDCILTNKLVVGECLTTPKRDVFLKPCKVNNSISDTPRNNLSNLSNFSHNDLSLKKNDNVFLDFANEQLCSTQRRSSQCLNGFFNI